MANDTFPIYGLFPAGTVAVGTTYSWVAKAPADAKGGGYTILEGGVITNATNAAGSAPQFRVLKYAAAGTVTGTIVATQVPGTAALTADTPSTFTISNGWVDGGEYIVVERGGTAVSATSAKQEIYLNAVMGR
jgi:hypothetical protein